MIDQPRHIISSLLLLFSATVLAESSAKGAYEQARQLNDKKEYLDAAKSFRTVQDLALIQNDTVLYLQGLLAEGECYYMLNFVDQLSDVLHRVDDSILFSCEKSEVFRWQLREAYYKLLGSYYYCLADAEADAYTKAADAYSHCLQILDSLDNSDDLSTDYARERMIVHRELAGLYYKQRNYQQALQEIEPVVYDFFFDRGDKELGFVDAMLSYAIIAARLNMFDVAEEALSYIPLESEATPSVQRTKGKIRMMQSDVDGIDRRKQAKIHYEKYLALQKNELQPRLFHMTDAQREQYWLSLHDFLFDCYRLEDSAPEMLYDLALFCKGYLLEYGRPKTKPYTWKDVQKTLPLDACAVEFVQYNGKDDRRQLGALVLTRKSSPKFVHIVDLDSLKIHKLVPFITVSDAIRSTSSAYKDLLYSDRNLPSLIWTNSLMTATDGARTVYFSPDGILQQLAIEYIIPDSSRSCRRLSSTRQLISPSKAINPNNMLIVGDIDYSSAQLASTQGNDEVAYTYFRPYSNSLSHLPYTRLEIDSIAALFGFDNVRMLSGNEATDSAFIAEVSHFPVVHIATHGAFVGDLEDGTDLKPVLFDNTLSQSGVAFAGVQHALRDTRRGTVYYDGLLSAKELASLPLDNVELIVLSACQTGLGYITADGVYGIQRALKQAGVKAMIVSLWSVNDRATTVLMKHFYHNLHNGLDMHDAFMLARKQLKNERGIIFQPGSMRAKMVRMFDMPQYTDAFILIDII